MTEREAILHLLSEMKLKVEELQKKDIFEVRSIPDEEFNYYYTGRAVIGDNYLHQCTIKIIDSLPKYKNMLIKISIIECDKMYSIDIELRQERNLETYMTNNINATSWGLWSGEEKLDIIKGLEESEKNIDYIMEKYYDAYKYSLR